MKKTIFSFLIFSLFLASGLYSGESRLALVVDSPSGRLLKTETSLFSELIQRIAGDFDLRFSDEEIDWQEYDQAILFQGDDTFPSCFAESPFFSESFVNPLKDWLKTDPEHGLILMGGAAAMADSLELGPADWNSVKGNDDREETGMIPVNPSHPFFDGMTIDRNSVWMTNALYPKYVQWVSHSPRVRVIAMPTASFSNQIQVILGGDEQDPTAQVFVCPYLIHPLFSMAAEEFRSNTERFVQQMITFCGKRVDDSLWTAPEWVLDDTAPLHRALETLMEESEEDFPNGENFQKQLEQLEAEKESIASVQSAQEWNQKLAQLTREVVLADPAIDFDQIIFLRREDPNKGFPANYNSNSTLPPTGSGNQIERLNIRTGARDLLFRPEDDAFVGDIDLHFDADRFLFSMPDKNLDYHWRIWESHFNSDGSISPPEQVQQIMDLDVDNYDACYLPDGRMIFCSTGCFTGVPCINGSGHVVNLYLRELDGSVRQLTVEQDHDWCPTVMNNGRVMYLRWEYSDLPHCYSRIMFHMNPDGTNQSELYGSGSYWPESTFFARPLPDSPTKFVGIVTGHHEQPRVGDLVLFDPAISRHEADGAIQRLPGYGKKVQPEICDFPIGQTWPKFTHPYPVSDRLFLASCKRNADANWELVLIDTDDNIVTIASDPSAGLFEPVPVRSTPKPPAISDRIRKESETADVFIADIYTGRGMNGVERGTVKGIRIISYEFSYQGMGAEPYSIGLDGPWDPKRILGTVPVYEDGSASFKIPALTPVAFQPIDEEGKAIQLMRSWVTAEPGESISCIGCHEEQNETGMTTERSIASKSVPDEITPFDGPVHGFSFKTEIQPILDHYCLNCHHSGDGGVLPDFTETVPKPLVDSTAYINVASPFSQSYYQLRRYVRTPTKESQMPTHKPFDFYADSTWLVQLLQQGHYGVKLDQDSWNRLLTWIDVNAPCYGNWMEIRGNEIPEAVGEQYQRRNELRELYGGNLLPLGDDPKKPLAVHPVLSDEPDPLRSRLYQEKESPITLSSDSDATPSYRSIQIDSQNVIDLVLLPGTNVEMMTTEVTNQLYSLFDAAHDTGIEYGDFINFSPGELGWLLNRPKQPVARVSQKDALRFCRWLSAQTGEQFDLPTAEEWKYAACCGQESFPKFEGDDYALDENLADKCYIEINPFSWRDRVLTLPPWRPGDFSVDDRSRVASLAASYRPNSWGIYDILGNVAEWSSSFAFAEDGTSKAVVTGGSWATPLKRVERRRYFDPQVNIYDVGFRVVCRH